MAQPRYKSEVFIPVQKDDKSFEQRQKTLWGDMHQRMEQRRQQWESEVENMRKDFFRLKPAEKRRGSSENLLDTMDMKDIFTDTGRNGNKTFRVSFDVSEFQPNEINVRTQDQQLIVHAKHQGQSGSKSVSKEFSRQVDIPKDVDPNDLRSTLSSDGILQVEASVSAPAYSRIEQANEAPLNNGAPPLKSQLSGGGNTRQYKGGAVVTEEDGSRKYKITVEIGQDFYPEDIMVKTVDQKLLVSAKHEEKTPGRSSFKEFSREFDLPEDVDPNLVTASMTDDGKLLVEAPIIASKYSRGSYTNPTDPHKQPKLTIRIGK